MGPSNHAHQWQQEQYPSHLMGGRGRHNTTSEPYSDTPSNAQSTLSTRSASPSSSDSSATIKPLPATPHTPPPYTDDAPYRDEPVTPSRRATPSACPSGLPEYHQQARREPRYQPYMDSPPATPDADDVPLAHLLSTHIYTQSTDASYLSRENHAGDAPPPYAIAVRQSYRDTLIQHIPRGQHEPRDADEESQVGMDIERADDNLVGSKRKSSQHNPSPTPPGNPAPTGQQRPTSLSPQASNSSSSSLPMNPPNNLGRPPSYTYAPPGGLGAPPPNHGRPASPLPPINTGAPGYPSQQAPYPPQPGPPGYPPQGPPGGGYGHGYGQPPPSAPAPHGPPAAYNRPNNMAEVAGEGRSKAQLIVGIDFGTTFSGVAFAFATNTEAKEDIITEWPGAGNQTKQKIPTVLYYDQYQKVVGWGPDIADALAPTGYPKPGVQKVEWFKLQLMLSGNTYIDPINLPPLPPGKSEIDVAADYLFHLRQAMRNQLQKTLGEVFNREERNIRYYLTVPAIWNDAGKAATRAAAIQAGFLRDENDNRLTLITEPEAAAMFCSKTGLLNLKIHDAVLIVDCGGGTVDLIAYEVEEEQPFSVAECTAGSGDSCGSTALNRNFSNILRAKIRKMKLPDGSKTAGKVYAKCIMDFENRIKADFRNNGQKWAVDVGIEAEFPEAGIEEGYMTFTNEEILQCFEPVVNRILELVRNQIIAIQAQNRSLQNVLVVGGFGASEYLFQQIKLHVPPQFQSKVVRPMDSVAAIVKGAVTAGITERIVTHRVARRHYLMATLQPFKEGHHPEQYRVPSLDGKDRCKYTRQIFVQKGQRVKIGEPVKVSFFRQVAPGATLMYEDILYACDDDVCPEYTKDPRIKEVVTLTSDLSRKNLEKDFERMDTPQGTFYRVYFDIYLTLDGSEFNAELVCQGEVMGRCTARFR
ncbi:actin-like ATPase domain-containing protein [Stemphylium lycopersici]|uniref:Actin-like ATPase domain-containing protein n=1 Tax=Stemphylium lycopersici TaxID=183478 RepID=A0A364NBV5_STELY|nr:actin-like ATPase domain-containing protein [Stemphylium lycopersici]